MFRYMKKIALCSALFCAGTTVGMHTVKSVLTDLAEFDGKNLAARFEKSANGYALVKEDGRELCQAGFCAPAETKCSKSGNIICVPDTPNNQIRIINIKTECCFFVPYNVVEFSCDETRIIAQQKTEDGTHLLIFDTATGKQICSIYGNLKQLSPTAPTALVAQTWPIATILVDLKTGTQIGSQLGVLARTFSQDGRLVAAQRYNVRRDYPWIVGAYTEFYSAITGKLVASTSGHFERFIDADTATFEQSGKIYRVTTDAQRS